MNVQNLMAELERKHPVENEYLHAVKEVLESIECCLNCIDAFKIWHGRYLMELDARGFEKNKNNL